jgi:predicted enzyme related to lactoylglutathione lyase
MTRIWQQATNESLFLLNMNRVTHFEIPAEDTKRASEFYREVFGWKFNAWGSEDYLVVETGPNGEPGINGGLMKRKDAAQPVVCTIEVEDINTALKRIEHSQGVIVVQKMPVPGMGWLAYFKDTEGNIFGVWQADAEAK